MKKTIKQTTYERVLAYMAENEGWVTPRMIERDFMTERPQSVAPDSKDIAVALRRLVDAGACERAPTGLPYGFAQFKYRRSL